jgi:hypothetical protein
MDEAAKTITDIDAVKTILGITSRPMSRIELISIGQNARMTAPTQFLQAGTQTYAYCRFGSGLGLVTMSANDP